MRRWAAGLSLVCFIAALLWYFGAVEMIASRYEANQVRRQDHSAFQQWIRADANRAREFDTLSAYLDKQGVAKIIPVWTLTRGDAGRFPWCKGDDFVMPPRNDWQRIVNAVAP